MEVKLVTKDEVLFEGEAKNIIVPGKIGYMGILNNHAPLLSPLKNGEIKIDKNVFNIDGGFIKVSNNYVIILGER